MEKLNHELVHILKVRILMDRKNGKVMMDLVEDRIKDDFILKQTLQEIFEEDNKWADEVDALLADSSKWEV